MIEFTEEHELEVLRACAHDRKFFSKATSILKSHTFLSKSHSWIYRVMLDQYQENKEHPTLLYIKSRVRADFTDDTIADSHKELAISVFKQSPTQAFSSLQQLEKFVKYRNLQAAIDSAITHLNDGDIDVAYSEMSAACSKTRLQLYDEVRWIEEYEQRAADRRRRRTHPNAFATVATKIKQLDELIGGIQKGELGLIGGTTGRGKSIFMTHLGFAAVLAGWNVVHFTLEMPAEQVATRYDSRLFRIPHKKIKTDTLTSEEREFITMTAARRLKHFKDKMYIVSFPVRTCSIMDIRSVLEQRRAEGVPADLVIVDSGDHMLPLKSYSNFRLDTASVYWDLKSLAGDSVLGCGVWSTTQIKQELLYQIATSEGVSESYDKARIADIIGTLNQDKDQQNMMPPQIDFWLAKYRDGESKRLIKLSAQFAMMLFEEIEQKEPTDEHA